MDVGPSGAVRFEKATKANPKASGLCFLDVVNASHMFHSQQGALTLVKRTISGNVRCVSIFSFWAKLSGGLSRFATAPIYVQTVNFVDTRMRWLTTASTEDRGSVVPSADQSTGNREDDSGKGAKSFHINSMNYMGNAHSSSVNLRKMPSNGGHDEYRGRAFQSIDR